MTALFALGIALAQPGPEIGPIHFHQTVSVDQPFVYTMRGDRPEVTQGTLVVFEASRKALTPTQERQPIIYIGEWPVRIYASDAQRGCAAGWVPMVSGFTDASLYLGPDILPERVTELGAKRTKENTTRTPRAEIANAAHAEAANDPETVTDERALAKLAEASLRSCMP